jgi:hypothetical protein
MITSGQKTSLLVPYQLPEFIRDNPDYSNFVLFLQAYYEWLEQTGNVSDRSKNLLNYKDADATTNEFVQYFYNDFLQYFPSEILANKTEVLKIAKQMYQAKGTPASFQFFFRALYNSDVEYFSTKDVVFKASAGKWYVSKSLKLASADINFLATSNFRIFGETTKSIATIENVVEAGNKIEVFISNIERLFQSGEFVRIVDNNNQDIYFLNGNVVSSNTVGAEVLRAKIVGQISQIILNSTQRGQLYQGANTQTGYPGDPVVVFGGLNSSTGHGASATISTATKGSIKSIVVANNGISLLGGFGYSVEDSSQNAFSIINITNGGGAVANISGVNTATTVYVGNSFYNPVSTITNVPTDRIGLFYNQSLGISTANSTNYTWNGTTRYTGFSANQLSNLTTTLANALNFIAFSAYPISAVSVLNQGGGLVQTPVVTAQSLYKTSDGIALADLGALGILGPISVDSPGRGYSANDKINIIGGTGYGAYANVISVDGNGSITNVAYVYSTTNNYPTPLGGLGYRLSSLPKVNVANSLVTGSNVANLSIAGIVGQGAQFVTQTDRVGSITTINVSDYGQDYIAAPGVSFKVQDIVVNNIPLTNLPKRGDVVYQGSSLNTATYLATVDSLYQLQNNIDPTKNLYTLRVYNYNSTPNTSLAILNSNTNYSMYVSDSYKSTLLSEYGGININRYNNGIINYGDGTAKGNATFLNGLTIGQGQYLDTSGQPSSFDVLQSTNYNNYTYQITLEKEIAKYRSALLNLLHPTGMKVRGRFAMKSNSAVNTVIVNALQTGHTLYDFTGTNNSTVTVSSNGDFTQLSSNVIVFNNLYGANLANIILSNSSIRFTTNTGQQVFSEVASVNTAANTVTLKTNVWLTFANIASGTGSAGGNTINISNVYTSSYNLYNSNTTISSVPLQTILHIGDYIKVNNMVKLVTNVIYTNTYSLVSVNSNFTYAATGNVSLNKVLTASPFNTQLFGPIGTQYSAQLITEAGDFLITEDNNTLLIN